MTVELKIDIFDGTSGRVTKDGAEITRIAKVSGLSAAGPFRTIEAILALQTFGLTIGSPHPDIVAAPNFLLEDISFRGQQGSIYEFTLTYQGKFQEIMLPQIEVGTDLTQETTNEDYEGNKITVMYGSDEPQVPTISRLVPQASWTKLRYESVMPLAKSMVYVGKCNSGGWFAHPNAAAWSWLCTGISGTSNDNGKTYLVRYAFSYKPDDGWKEAVYYIDHKLGRMPYDAVEGTGYKLVTVYKTIDFDGLNLSADNLL